MLGHRRGRMLLLPAILGFGLGAALTGTAPARAATARYYAFNLTTATDFTGLYLAPAGTQDWGANQALNDKDHSLDASERLKLSDVSAGRFDVKLVDKAGHVCVKPGVDMTHDTSFDIRDADLGSCKQP